MIRKKKILNGAFILFIVTFFVYRVWPEEPLPEGIVADKLIVYKSKKIMYLIKDEDIVKAYSIVSGRNSGPKTGYKDNKTPEGKYYIVSRMHTKKYHMSLRISYPNEIDIRNSIVDRTQLGAKQAIHGIRYPFGWLGRWHRLVNWTRGCIAVTNDEIEELWRSVPDGTPIEIYP